MAGRYKEAEHFALSDDSRRPDQAFPCFQQALNNCNNDTYSECYRQASVPCRQAEYSCQQQYENNVQIAGRQAARASERR